MLLNRRWCANEKSWKGSGVYETWLLPTWSDRGTLEIILYVCQYNIVILNSHCHTISLLGILIWKVGFISFPMQLDFLLLPLRFILSPLTLSSPLLHTHTHTSINISITLDDYWETWAILCNHGLLFPAAHTGDHSFHCMASACHYHNRVLNSFCVSNSKYRYFQNKYQQTTQFDTNTFLFYHVWQLFKKDFIVVCQLKVQQQLCGSYSWQCFSISYLFCQY